MCLMIMMIMAVIMVMMLEVMKMVILVLGMFCTLGAIPIHLWRESWVEKRRAARAGEEK